MSYEKEDHLSHYEENAVEYFKEQIFDLHSSYEDLLIFCEQDQPGDIISEVADGACPIYTHTIMQLAANNTQLATEESELGGTTPLEIISQNIYCALEAAQYEWWRDNKDELEEECRAIIDAEEVFDEAMGDPDETRTAEKIIEAIVKPLEEDEFASLGIKNEGEEIADIVSGHLAERHAVNTEKAREVPKEA